MKFFNIPREGVCILIWGCIGVFLLCYFVGCAPLTTLDSCKRKVGIEKEQCIEAVKSRQDRVIGRSELFGRR